MNIPLDDNALNLIDSALDFRWVKVEEDGTHIGSGEFQLAQLLEFWSGYDRAKLQPTEDPIVFVYPDPVISEHDLIRALVAEVRKLRPLAELTPRWQYCYVETHPNGDIKDRVTTYERDRAYQMLKDEADSLAGWNAEVRKRDRAVGSVQKRLYPEPGEWQHD